MLIRGSGVDAAAWCNISEAQGLGQEESFLQRPHYVPYLKYLLESLIMSVSEFLRLFTLELNLRVSWGHLAAHRLVGICSGQEGQGGEGAASERSSVEARDPVEINHQRPKT